MPESGLEKLGFRESLVKVTKRLICSRCNSKAFASPVRTLFDICKDG
jgi:hypothetical protein